MNQVLELENNVVRTRLFSFVGKNVFWWTKISIEERLQKD